MNLENDVNGEKIWRKVARNRGIWRKFLRKVMLLVARMRMYGFVEKLE